jgi:thiol-disulfide isomerase/thioredoxin
MNPTRKMIAIALAAAGVFAVGYLTDVYSIRPAVQRLTVHPAQPIAPPFRLTDIFGQKLSLGQYQGKVVLLDFWATWCGPCLAEIPDLIRLQKAYGTEGFQVIGISEDQEGAVPAVDLYRRAGINYRVGVDPGAIRELYGGISGFPTTFLIGRDSRIHEEVLGAVGADFFAPRIEKLLDKPAASRTSSAGPD